MTVLLPSPASRFHRKSSRFPTVATYLTRLPGARVTEAAPSVETGAPSETVFEESIPDKAVLLGRKRLLSANTAQDIAAVEIWKDRIIDAAIFLFCCAIACVVFGVLTYEKNFLGPFLSGTAGVFATCTSILMVVLSFVGAQRQMIYTRDQFETQQIEFQLEFAILRSNGGVNGSTVP